MATKKPNSSQRPMTCFGGRALLLLPVVAFSCFGVALALEGLKSPREEEISTLKTNVKVVYNYLVTRTQKYILTENETSAAIFLQSRATQEILSPELPPENTDSRVHWRSLVSSSAQMTSSLVPAYRVTASSYQKPAPTSRQGETSSQIRLHPSKIPLERSNAMNFIMEATVAQNQNSSNSSSSDQFFFKDPWSVILGVILFAFFVALWLLACSMSLKLTGWWVPCTCCPPRTYSELDSSRSDAVRKIIRRELYP